ncbi:DUF6153 family protein [Isoptericola sp. NPDC057391]|uniref:DUF6153 family protein n=1 Tax=Isoptericola sp. NPDC057391 TaxID=3346117 RepID=UPI003638E7AB
MIRTVRPLLTGRRGRLGGVLIVLALVVGVVLMHAMSGSATTHADHHAPVAVVAHDAPDAQGAGAPAGCGDSGCGGHEMVTAMCLMILAVLLALAGPGARALLRAEGPRAVAWLPLPAASRPAAGPDLHALGISRT